MWHINKHFNKRCLFIIYKHVTWNQKTYFHCFQFVCSTWQISAKNIHGIVMEFRSIKSFMRWPCIRIKIKVIVVHLTGLLPRAQDIYPHYAAENVAQWAEQWMGEYKADKLHWYLCNILNFPMLFAKNILHDMKNGIFARVCVGKSVMLYIVTCWMVPFHSWKSFKCQFRYNPQWAIFFVWRLCLCMIMFAI